MSKYKVIDSYPDYEMSEDGQVRKISTKKFASICKDAIGRSVVVLRDSKYCGESRIEYISDLLAVVFNIIKPNQIAIVPSEEVLKVLPQAKVISKKSKRDKSIMCIETEEVFSSFASAARAYHYKYDKFYDAVNLKGEYDGNHWKRLDKDK